jgi:hypothetical protein
MLDEVLHHPANEKQPKWNTERGREARNFIGIQWSWVMAFYRFSRFWRWLGIWQILEVPCNKDGEWERESTGKFAE